jgi:hypothetical protein
MPLPPFRDDGWLPEGHHPTTWEEIAAVFGGESGSRRAQIHARLLAWRDAARARGMAGLVILDGSFISRKAEPGDFDAILVYDDATDTMLKQDPEARALVDCANCKDRFGGDIFAFWEGNVRQFPRFCRIDGFDLDKVNLQPKGVVEVTL